MKHEAHRNWRQPLIWLLKANIAVWIIDLVVLAFLEILGYDWLLLIAKGYFPTILLLETGVALLIGGAMAFSSSAFSSKAKRLILHSEEKWSIDKLRQSEKRANAYIILGILLFLQSIILSLLV